MWNHCTSLYTGRCWHLTYGIGGYCTDWLKYQDFWSVNSVLYYWSSVRCIKIWIVIYCRGLKFPHTAVVLLVLESDGACTGLNGHSARETEVLVLVWCYKARGDRERDLWRYWLSEGCIKQWCDKPSVYGCVNKKCEQGEHDAVTLLYLVSSPRCPTYRVKIQDLKHYVSHHWPVSAVK